MNKYYLVKLSYNGIRYFGWQKQKQFKSIHGEFEMALQKSVGEEIQTHSIGASRTDARVHAFGQVVRVNLTDLDLSPEELMIRLNKELPFDIRVENIVRTHPHFKVMLYAIEKEYLYFFTNKPKTTPWMFPYLVNFEEELDLEKMKIAAEVFIGRHDFKNFAYRGNNVKDSYRKVYHCEIIENYNLDLGDTIIKGHCLRIRGNGFLKQMVRLIVGSLVQVGNGQIQISDIEESLKTDSDKKVGFIAPPHGLFLNKIKYPEKYMDKEL